MAAKSIWELTGTRKISLPSAFQVNQSINLYLKKKSKKTRVCQLYTTWPGTLGQHLPLGEPAHMTPGEVGTGGQQREVGLAQALCTGLVKSTGQAPHFSPEQAAESPLPSSATCVCLSGAAFVPGVCASQTCLHRRAASPALLPIMGVGSAAHSRLTHSSCP